MSVVLEIAVRLFFGVPLTDPTNYATERMIPGWSREATAVNSMYHPVLGWTFSRGEGNPHGLIPRKRDPRPPEPGKTILVAGDSFGTGDDPELNWPNQLEELVNLPVINGSAGGWGIDQIYPRLESLIPEFRPGLLIFNFIPDDVRRAELSVFFGAPKAYFEVQGRQLILRNSPPARYEPSRKHMGWIRALFGRSYTLYLVADALGLKDRWAASGLELRREHKRGDEVGCLIMVRLRELQRQYGIRRVIVFPEYASTDIWNVPEYQQDSVEKQRRILDCARAQGLTVADPLDLYKSEGTTPEKREQVLRKYWRYPFDPHMSFAGDRMLAEFLANTVVIPAPAP